MHYEIYIDSLFLLHFGLNLYLLELVNEILHFAASVRRVLLGAAVGGLLCVAPILLTLIWPFSMGAASLLGLLLELLAMSQLTFQVREKKMFLHILELLGMFTILLGAMLQYLLRHLPPGVHTPVILLLVLGGICFLVIHRVLGRAKPSFTCRVTLKNGGVTMKIDALVDTGSSLIEPISGKPAAVLDKGIFENLFSQEKPAGFRVIPYRTIDKKAGILPGYPIPYMRVEWKGMYKEFQNVYVGIRQEMEEGMPYKMILNPEMLKERKTG